MPDGLDVGRLRDGAQLGVAALGEQDADDGRPCLRLRERLSARLRVPVLRWMNTATFHNLHHTSFNGNYGLMFRFWDRMLGTELDTDESAFVQRGAQGATARCAMP